MLKHLLSVFLLTLFAVPAMAASSIDMVINNQTDLYLHLESLPTSTDSFHIIKEVPPKTKLIVATLPNELSGIHSFFTAATLGEDKVHNALNTSIFVYSYKNISTEPTNATNTKMKNNYEVVWNADNSTFVINRINYGISTNPAKYHADKMEFTIKKTHNQ